MKYTKDGQPYTFQDLKKDNPNIGFPVNALSNADIRAEYNVVEVPFDPSKESPFNIQLVEPDPPEDHSFDLGDPEYVDGNWRQTWVYTEMGWEAKRRRDYGPAEEQIEFITENGLESWQSKVSEIKSRYPKE